VKTPTDPTAETVLPVDRSRSPDYGTFQLTTPKVGTVTFTEAKECEPASGFAWDTGDTLTVTTTGGAIPSFSLTDTVPAQATVTSHDLPSLQPNQLVIPRSAPFAITWAPVTTEVFLLVLQFDDASNPRKGLWCFYPGAAGSASIPAEALAHLLPSQSVTSTNLYFRRRVAETARARGDRRGDDHVEVRRGARRHRVKRRSPRVREERGLEGFLG